VIKAFGGALGRSWRSRVAAMRGRSLVGISAASRAACWIGAGDVVEVDLMPEAAGHYGP
jgi:hypothetical protein